MKQWTQKSIEELIKRVIKEWRNERMDATSHRGTS